MTADKPARLAAEEVIADTIGHTEGEGWADVEALSMAVDIVRGLTVHGYTIVHADSLLARDEEVGALRRQLYAAKIALKAAEDEARNVGYDRDSARASHRGQQRITLSFHARLNPGATT